MPPQRLPKSQSREKGRAGKWGIVRKEAPLLSFLKHRQRRVLPSVAFQGCLLYAHKNAPGAPAPPPYSSGCCCPPSTLPEVTGKGNDARGACRTHACIQLEGKGCELLAQGPVPWLGAAAGAATPLTPQEGGLGPGITLALHCSSSSSRRRKGCSVLWACKGHGGCCGWEESGGLPTPTHPLLPSSTGGSSVCHALCLLNAPTPAAAGTRGRVGACLRLNLHIFQRAPLRCLQHPFSLLLGPPLNQPRRA